MLIGKEWKLESDGLNIILSQKKKWHKKDTGEIYEPWRVVGYFSTVANALHELVNQKVRDTELKDIKTIMTEIEHLHNLIDRHFKRPREAIEVGKT